MQQLQQQLLRAAQTAITTLSNLATIGTITTGSMECNIYSYSYGGTGLTSVGSSGQILVSNGSALVIKTLMVEHIANDSTN